MLVFRWIFCSLIFLSLSHTGLAVTTAYLSADDEDITLKTVALSTGRDNVQGIYAKPLTEHLRQIIGSEHFLDFKESPTPLDVDLNELRGQPALTTKLLTQVGADSLIHLQVSKGQMGLRFELGLFTRKSGQLWSYVDLLETEKLDLEYAKETVSRLYEQLIRQLPFQGLILSRQGTKITVSRGSLGGLKADQEIEVIQVIGVKRHPQFQFVTEVQKQIIGKIRITSIDETLSFGYILFEKESQSLQPGLKLLIREPILYPALADSKNKNVVDHLLSRGDGAVIMQGNAKEWVPEDAPTFGRAHILFGLGEFEASTKFTTSGSKQESTLFAANANMDADLWLTKTWFIHAGLNQGSARLSNPLPGSSPEHLNFSLQTIRMAVGYDLGVSTDLYGPRLKGMIGNSQFRARTTDSTPTSYTSMAFSGLGFGLNGYTPLGDEGTAWGLGAEFWYHLMPSVKETPVKSGKGRSTHIVQIAWTAYYKTKPNLYWIGKFSVDNYKTSFSGVGTRTGEGATSAELSWKHLNFGVEYLF